MTNVLLKDSEKDFAILFSNRGINTIDFLKMCSNYVNKYGTLETRLVCESFGVNFQRPNSVNLFGRNTNKYNELMRVIKEYPNFSVGHNLLCCIDYIETYITPTYNHFFWERKKLLNQEVFDVKPPTLMQKIKYLFTNKLNVVYSKRELLHNPKNRV